MYDLRPAQPHTGLRPT